MQQKGCNNKYAMKNDAKQRRCNALCNNFVCLFEQVTSLADLQRLHPWSDQRGNGGALASLPAPQPAQFSLYVSNGICGRANLHPTQLIDRVSNGKFAQMRRKLIHAGEGWLEFFESCHVVDLF